MASDKHAAVTACLVAELENGVAPWARPWSTAGTSDLPHNAATARPYHGANVLALWMEQAMAGYPTAEWMMFQQARERGACICKGKHGTGIFYVYRVATHVDRCERRRGNAANPISPRLHVFNVALA